MDKETRYRSRGVLPAVNSEYNQYKYLWDNCDHSTWFTSGGAYLLPVGEFHDMTDQVIPDYFRRKLRGEIFFNSMQQHSMVHTRSSGVGSWRKSTTPIVCGGTNRYPEIQETLGITDRIYAYKKGLSYTAPIPPMSLISSDDIGHLITELSTELQNQRGRPEADLWEAIAEADKSFVLLTEMFNTLERMTGQAKKEASVKGVLVGASSLWLLSRYGLGPLVNDIANVVKGLSELTGKRRTTLREKGSLYSTSTETLTHTDATVSRLVKVVYHDRAIVRVMTLDEYTASVGFNLGFSLKGLITLPWELIRLSFVLDWFANIGSFLGALVPAVGATQLGSALVVERIRTTNLLPGGDYPTGVWVPVRSQTATFVATDTTKTRNAGLPVPGLLIKGDFRFHKLKRCLDSLSLLIVAMGGLSMKSRKPPVKKRRPKEFVDWTDNAA